jgi:release factor glutamine methyltransferase
VSDALVWREALADAEAALGSARDARLLCEHAAGLSASEFSIALGEPVTQRMALHLHEMIRRRLTGEPVQYVMGRWAFRHLDLLVDRRVLIPRPETEQVAQVALQFARAATPRVIVDLGTGSGAIGLSLAQELPLDHTTVWMTDASPDALDVARANAAGLGRAAASLRIAQGDWYAALPANLRGVVDVVVSNPPYIASNDPETQPDVVTHEPHEALFAGDDGLAALRVVVSESCEWLRPGGALVVEIGHQQGAAVRAMCEAASLRDIAVLRDHAGHERIVTARR